MRDAPAYLGMDREIFNAVARPVLTEIPIGVQGRAFDPGQSRYVVAGVSVPERRFNR